MAPVRNPGMKIPPTRAWNHFQGQEGMRTRDCGRGARNSRASTAECDARGKDSRDGIGMIREKFWTIRNNFGNFLDGPFAVRPWSERYSVRYRMDTSPTYPA